MTKKDILNKIKRTILGEDSTPGIVNTNKVQKTDKKFNDEYYKSANKKFKDYLGLKKDTFDVPKVNTDDELELTYHGSGMEGLTYDNEGTEVEKKFVKRNDDLNKPSKDYYLKKDEINDVYKKKKKEGESYRKQKKIFQNTPPVRAIAAEKIKSENTIKRLTFKNEFISESAALKLIPEEFKKNDMVFEMTDGNKLLKVRWEGSANKGNPVILLNKDEKKINEELNRMYQLFEYNSREKFGKSNLMTEDIELQKTLNKFKNINEVDDQTQKDTIKQKLSKRPTVGANDIVYGSDGSWVYGTGVKNMGDDEFRNKIKEVATNLLNQGNSETKVLNLMHQLGGVLGKDPSLKEKSSVLQELNLAAISGYKK